MYVNCVCDLLSVAPNGNRIRAPPSNEAPSSVGDSKTQSRAVFAANESGTEGGWL